MKFALFASLFALLLATGCTIIGKPPACPDGGPPMTPLQKTDVCVCVEKTDAGVPEYRLYTCQ